MNRGRAKIKANPIPAAMAGIGLYLLMRDDDRADDIYEIDDVRYDPMYGHTHDVERSHSHTRIDAMQDRVHDRLQGRLQDRLRDRMDDVRDRVSSGIDRARSSGQDLLSSNPLILGVAAIALGAIAGSLIPETEREDRLFGEHRDKLMNRGRDLAHEGMDRAKNVASTVASTVTEKAKEAAKDAAKGDARM